MKVRRLCMGSTTRDLNSASQRAADALGLLYKEFAWFAKNHTLYGSKWCVKQRPNWITIGDDCGEVYFALSSDGERLKIGWSRNPVVRVNSLQPIIGDTLTILHTESGFKINESAYHVQGRPAWLGGEWFDFDLLCQIPFFAFLRRDKQARAV